MNADSDYARIVDILSKQRLAPYVAYTSRVSVNGLGASDKAGRIIVRVSDGKVVSGSTHFKVDTGGRYDATDVNPVSHPAFDPHCYRATDESPASFEGRAALRMTLVATCKSPDRGDDDYPFTTLFADPRTLHPIDVYGVVPQTDVDKMVRVSLDQRFEDVEGRVMPSSFKLDLSGSGMMFWLQMHLRERYGNYQFLDSLQR